MNPLGVGVLTQFHAFWHILGRTHQNCYETFVQFKYKQFCGSGINLSRILIFIHPGSRILDPKTATKERYKKNLLCFLFLKPQISQIENYFIFELVKKKIWAVLRRITELFTPKIVIKLSIIWVCDTGSEIRDGKILFWVPDPGVKIGIGSQFRNTEYKAVHPPHQRYCIFNFGLRNASESALT